MQEGRDGWLATLPGSVGRLADAWSLTVGEPFQPGGQTAWVAPVRDAAGKEKVLKVGWRHPEALHEAEGLRAWAGQGAVLRRRVHASSCSRSAALKISCAFGLPAIAFLAVSMTLT